MLRAAENLEAINGLARILASQKLQDLLALTGMGDVEHLLEALDHCGEDVHEQAFYTQLVESLNVPAMAAIVRARKTGLSLTFLDLLQRTRYFDPALQKAVGLGLVRLRFALILQSVIDAAVERHGEQVRRVFSEALENWKADSARSIGGHQKTVTC